MFKTVDAARLFSCLALVVLTGCSDVADSTSPDIETGQGVLRLDADSLGLDEGSARRLVATVTDADGNTV
ncbi:MAG TPA: hypothetical protein VF035_04110, partial [Longimicrobiales bacterium]